MDAGLLAEFATPEALLGAIRGMRGAGYTALDAYSPYPMPEAEEALGFPRSKVPRFVLAGGLFGATGAYLLQWYFNAYDYPLNVGGRPPHMTSAFIIVCFEMAVLFAAFAAIFSSIFYYARLPRLWHPAAEVDGFERATIDRFFLILGAGDPKYDPDAAEETLKALGAMRVVELGGGR
jgi:hypothetical protein